MKNNNWTPQKIAEAKKLTSGPLGKTIAKFPLRFAMSILIGNPLDSSLTPDVNSGTATLVDLGRGPMVITCKHVLDQYRARLNLDLGTRFQVGNLQFDPLPHIIAEGRRVDLVTIDLKGLKISDLLGEEEIGRTFFQPHTWPPKPLMEGEFVSFGGFPGLWREQVRRREFEFSAFTAATSKVGFFSNNYFVIQLEREYWIKIFNYDDRADLHRLDGLSGAPVFSERRMREFLTTFELVGVAYQFSEEFDLLYAILVQLIRNDGRLEEG